MAVWDCALWGEEWKEGTEGRDGGERAGARRPAGGEGDGKCALAVFNICSRERERERGIEREQPGCQASATFSSAVNKASKSVQ